MNDTRQVCLVLGAAGGIGSALSRRLSEAGTRLVVAGRDGERIEALAREVGARGLCVDAARGEEVETAVRVCLEDHGRLDAVACCAGSLLLKPAHLTRDDEWSAVLESNLTTVFNTVRFATRAMEEAGGAIVLVSSAAARTGLANHEAIAAAKAGIIGLTISAAATYAPRGIRVNCIAPGLVETPLTQRILRSVPARRASEAMHALGRVGRPEEIASAIAWLMQADQAWVTGQVIGVDGGLATVRPRPADRNASAGGGR